MVWLNFGLSKNFCAFEFGDIFKTRQLNFRNHGHSGSTGAVALLTHRGHYISGAVKSNGFTCKTIF
jgi:hypothetical protein